MKNFIVSLLLILVATLGLSARKVSGFTSDNAANTPLVLMVDAIDFRPDLTRVYGKFMGQPHTSNRADAILLETAGHSYTSNDIDGVDFKRYFQWEDDGVIPIEIDFPAMPAATRSFVIKVTTPRGISIVKVKKK